MQADTGASLSPGEAPSRRRVGLLAIVALVVLVLDQATKWLAASRLSDGEVIPLLGSLLSLRLVRNPGAAFSFATGYTYVLTILAIVIVIGILRVARRLGSVAWAVALGGLLGGALGNLGDRIFRQPAPLRGHVVDFLELPYWPVFNLADSAIVGSAVLIALLSVRGVELTGSTARAAQRPETDG